MGGKLQETATPDVTDEVVGVVEGLAREKNIALPEQLRYPSRHYSRVLYSVLYLDF